MVIRVKNKETQAKLTIMKVKRRFSIPFIKDNTDLLKCSVFHPELVQLKKFFHRTFSSIFKSIILPTLFATRNFQNILIHSIFF